MSFFVPFPPFCFEKRCIIEVSICFTASDDMISVLIMSASFCLPFLFPSPKLQCAEVGGHAAKGNRLVFSPCCFIISLRPGGKEQWRTGWRTQVRPWCVLLLLLRWLICTVWKCSRLLHRALGASGTGVAADYRGERCGNVWPCWVIATDWGDKIKMTAWDPLGTLLKAAVTDSCPPGGGKENATATRQDAQLALCFFPVWSWPDPSGPEVR